MFISLNVEGSSKGERVSLMETLSLREIDMDSTVFRMGVSQSRKIGRASCRERV